MEQSKLPLNLRQVLVLEIEHWRKEGSISGSQAKALSSRYDYDFTPPPPIPAPTPPPLPAQVQPATPPKPRLTLAQTLLSETSIRIALYLGAFFVISASLILAALVADLRLPILVVVTLLFAGGALLLKRRLPQPSFILFLVFSTLLPITGSVISDLMNLSGKVETGFWVGLLAGMALLWAFSTWFYKSRFFSLASLVALDAALVMTVIFIKDSPFDLYMLLLTLASLAGLSGAYLLKRWQGKRLALPVFVLAQVQQGLILVIVAALLLVNIVDAPRDWRLVTGATWLLTGLFYGLSNLLFPFILFPYLAVAALMPVTWLAVATPDSRVYVSSIAVYTWGVVFLLLGNLWTPTRERLRMYTLPLIIASVLLLLIGSVIGLNEGTWLGFSLLLGAAILFSLAHAFHNRLWLWAVALGTALAAFFTFFELPFMAKVNFYIIPQLAIATFLLLLPDMLFTLQKPLRTWRLPLRGWAILMGTLVLGWTLFEWFAGDMLTAVLTLGGLALLYLAYALRMRLAWMAILFSLHGTLAILHWLVISDNSSWLLIMTIPAVLFYGIGYLLQRKKFPAWSLVFRWSGLVLAGLLSFAAFAYPGNERAIYVVILAALFLVETLQNRWLETIPPLLISLAFGMALFDLNVKSAAWYPAGIAVIFLGADLLYTFFKKRTDMRWATRVLGALAALMTPFFLALTGAKPLDGIVICVCLAAIFLVQVLVYRQFLLGYATTFFLSLAVLFPFLSTSPIRWLWPLVTTALVFYLVSLLMPRLKQPGWEPVLRNSGVVLATLTALSAPFEGSGAIASLPVAIAASLWAVEALRRRMIWLGFPATALYLMAYFMLLATLHVDQAQFYSVGAAALGMVMHYLLVRGGGRTSAFLTGMISQLILLGTTYIQFVSTEDIWYFVVLFFQSLAVLIYGIVIRSRSLVITPIVLVSLGVVTVIFGVLRGISTVILIGCTGIGLILMGIAALLLRERFTTLRDRLKKWRA